MNVQQAEQLLRRMHSGDARMTEAINVLVQAATNAAPAKAPPPEPRTKATKKTKAPTPSK